MDEKGLIELHDEVNRIKAEIKEIEEDEQVEKYLNLQSDLKLAEGDLKNAVNDTAEEVEEWVLDPKDKNHKKELFSMGRVEILRSTRTEREIITEKFMEKFPIVGYLIAHIPVGDAEEALKKTEDVLTDDLVTKKTSYKYTIYVRKTAAKKTTKKPGAIKAPNKGQKETKKKVMPVGRKR